MTRDAASPHGPHARLVAAICSELRDTEVGRAFGFSRIETLDDFRAAIPLMTQDAHARDVEARLGFGVDDPSHHEATSNAAIERPQTIARWRSLLAADGRAPEVRALVLQARDHDPAIDRIRGDDLRALGGQLRRVTTLEGDDDLARLEETLASYQPTVLMVPSAHTCAFLEASLHGPLDRRVPSLALILATHDLERRLRAVAPLGHAGWITRSGRLGVPSPRPPARAFTLAVESQLVELLPHTRFDVEGRAIPPSGTILPEHAIVGERYELVVSAPLGFLRVRTDEHVRVVGFDPPTQAAPIPRPRVIHLQPPAQDVALDGVSLVGTWLTASVRRAFRPEDPALVAATIGPDPASAAVDPKRSAGMDPFAETELGGAVRQGPPRPRARRLLVQVEVQGQVRAGFEARLAAAVDRDLRRRNPAYAHLRERKELTLPRVVNVEPGSFRGAQLRRIRSLRGQVDAPEVRVVDHAPSSIFPSTRHGRRAS
ncbi:MAG: hypothetical protein R3A51_10900 [Nannocystaceae bacterium]|nr:hypothetical protein [Myxococcales bacterium]